MIYFLRICLFPLAALLLVFSAPAVAKEKPEWRSWPMGDRLSGTIAYYKPRLDTNATISDANGNLGALISFEDTLGLSKNKATPIIAAAWRISRRNALSFNYFKLDRSSTQDSTIDIFVANPAPPPDYLTTSATLPLAAFFNIESADITYAFSPIFNEKHNLGLGLGLALQNLQFGIQATDNCDIPACTDFGAPREAKATAPLPTFKIIYQYAINDKWLVDTNLGYFALDLELDSNEKIGGSIVDLTAGLRWKTWKNVGFNFGYKFFDVNLDYEKRDLRAEAKYKYNGFLFGINAYF